jgi:hypothetical protein
VLRVMPEGSEFLMRWRFSDIQKFLNGETVDAGQILRDVHDLFTRNVNFSVAGRERDSDPHIVEACSRSEV